MLGKVSSTRYVDRVQVRLVSGQSAAEVADRAENLAHGFGAMLCRVRTARSGAVLLEFVRRDALAKVVRPAPMPTSPDLRALEVGRRETGYRGWCRCTALTSWSPGPPGRVRRRCCGDWSGPCSR